MQVTVATALCLLLHASVGFGDLISSYQHPDPKSISSDVRLKAARTALAKNDIAGAREQLAMLPLDDASHPEIVLAQLLSEAGNRVEARNVLEALSAKAEHAYETHLLFAEFAIRESRWFDASTHVAAARRLTPPKRWSATRREQAKLTSTRIDARAAEGRQDWKRAEVVYRDGLKQQSDAADLHAGLARVAFNLNRTSDAVKHFTDLRKLKPEIELPHLAVAHMFHGRGQATKAEKHFKLAISSKEQPARSKAVLAYADWLLFQNRGSDAAAALADQDFDDTLSTERTFTRALAARMQGKLTEARKMLSTLHQQDAASFPISNQLALVLIEEADESLRSRALQIAESNVRNNPNLAEAWSTLGWVQFRLGDVASAEKNLATAMKNGVASRDTAIFMAKVKERLGDSKTAEELRKASLAATGAAFATDLVKDK